MDMEEVRRALNPILENQKIFGVNLYEVGMAERVCGYFQELTAVDFSDLAQGCKTYGEFVEKMGRVPESDLRYLGIAICGAKRKVNRLTGSMPLLR